ncbi:MAG: hypothetical protein HOV81_36465, partial [Kofleriaceae bacterium]|nr:hypothetical protein [Kofleriaceae bacterium]
DETMGRIAGLADGWSVDAPSTPPPPIEAANEGVGTTAPSSTSRSRSDATMGRIAGLADGWSVDAPSTPPPATPRPASPSPDAPSTERSGSRAKAPWSAGDERANASSAAPSFDEPAPTPRKKQRTIPPPPPGSPERKALEDKILATRAEKDDPTDPLDDAIPSRIGAGPSGGAIPPPNSVAPPAGANRTGAVSIAQPPNASGRTASPTSQPIATNRTGAVPVAQPPNASGRTASPSSQPIAANRTGGMPAIQPPSTSQATKSPPMPPPIPTRSGSTSAPPPIPPLRSKPTSVPPATAKPSGATAPRVGNETGPHLPLPLPAPEQGTQGAPTVPGTAARSPTSGPRFPRAGYDGPAQPFAVEQKPFQTEASTPAVIVDDSIRLPVPVGEFDSGVQTIEDPRGEDRSRGSQATLVRDPAEALLKIPDQETPVEDLLDDDRASRSDVTAIDPTAKFERGDQTEEKRPDATEIEAPMARAARNATVGTLRPSASLRRKRGALGDVRYVFTALGGVRASKKELAELERKQVVRQASRRRHLVTLGRTAVITDAFDHPALAKAHEQLAAIEDERSRHAGAVSASDAELERVRRDRENKSKNYLIETSETDAALAEIAKKLEPLEKEAAGVRKKAAELREQVQRIQKKIADTEALLVSVKGEKMDKAGIHADIVTYKADLKSVQRDEPALAAELDALNPRIAALEANRTELQKKRRELDKAEAEDQKRTTELLEAIGAKRKVVERAAAEAEAARDSALFDLGERLYVDRPRLLGAQLSPIDTIDLEVGEADRRAMELREIIGNVDKLKLARGLALMIVTLAVVGSFVAWLLYMLG